MIEANQYLTSAGARSTVVSGLEVRATLLVGAAANHYLRALRYSEADTKDNCQDDQCSHADRLQKGKKKLGKSHSDIVSLSPARSDITVMLILSGTSCALLAFGNHLSLSEPVVDNLLAMFSQQSHRWQ